MTKHKKHCKGKDVPATVETEQPTNEVPKGFAKGGEHFKPIFKAFLVASGLASVNSYFNKGVKVLEFYETVDKKFYVDKLLYMMDTNCTLPPLSIYLKRDGATDADRKTAITAYKYICRTLVEQHETRYGSDERFEFPKKNAFKEDLVLKRDEYDADMRRANMNMNRDTADKAAAAVNSQTSLTYNPERLKEVTAEILELDVFETVKDDLIFLPDEEFVEKYEEPYVRKVLSTESLITTGGKRPSTITQMTLGELRNAEKLPDGSWDVSVRNHKTKPRGSSHLSFIRKKLYAALRRYDQIYKKGKSEKTLLFCTSSGKAHDMKYSIAWLKSVIPSSVASEEELKTLSAKSFRKGFSDWGADHPDPIVNRDIYEAQDYSKRTDELNYHIKNSKRVNNVNKAVMSQIRLLRNYSE